jgi:hypothetical protein
MSSRLRRSLPKYLFDYEVRNLCLGRLIITGDEHLHLAAFAPFGWEKPGEDRVERLHDLGAWGELLNLFCGRGGVPDRKPLEVGSDRVRDVDDNFVRQIARSLECFVSEMRSKADMSAGGDFCFVLTADSRG